MILAVGDHAEIYRSPDLKAWTLASAFGKGLSTLCWECPDLFSLPDENGGDVWILSISLLDRDNFKGKVAACVTEYFAGTFDGFTFAANGRGARPLGHGPDDYAAVTFADAPDGCRILLGWLNHWGYSSYSGQMTLPRQLRWQDGALAQTLPSLAEQAHPWHRVEIKSLEDDIPPTILATSPWEIVMPPGPISWHLDVRKGNALIFTLRRDTDRGVWSLMRASGSFPSPWKDQKEGLEAAFTAPHEAPLSANTAQSTRIMVDACSVEVFCEGGRAYFSAQIFPPEGEWQLTLQAQSK
jgi:sucrose-6-phosphate hydrolase SacC (GH32 family)